MTSNFRIALLGFTALGCLAACSATRFDQGQYWQRASVSDSIYARGPKAQQMLNRDISHCVVELREMEGLGALKDAIPTDVKGKLPNPDEKALKDWDTPEREGFLLAEQSDYHDFDGCMLAKGWQRIKYVPYEAADRSRKTWIQTNLNFNEKERESALQHPIRPSDNTND